MKRMALLLFCCFFWSIQPSNAQSPGIQAKVVFVDSLVKRVKYRETAFQIMVFNNTDRHVYVPNLLVPFTQQVADSLFVYKLQDGKYQMIYRESGVRKGGAIAGIHGPTNYLTRQFEANFRMKKKFGESKVDGVTSLSGKTDMNGLFLAAREKFNLYQISTVDYLIQKPGDYRIDFRIRKRDAFNFPAEISGFQLFSSGEIPVEPLYISVGAAKAGSRLTIKDGKQKKIRSFLWK